MKILVQDYNIKDLLALRQSIIKTLITPVKFYNFFKIKISILFKLEKSLGFPINILVEPTRQCNYGCIQCPRQTVIEIKNLNKMEISLEDFKFIMKQIGRYLLTIRFWHWGEPLLNKELAEIIKVAKQYRIFTATSSNCSLLDEETSKDLIESGLDYLLVSLNSASSDNHKELTARDNFEEVIQNLKKFVDLKTKMKRGKPFLNIQFVVMKNNLKEIEKMKKLSAYLGVDKLSFKHLGFKHDELAPDDTKYHLKHLVGIEKIDFCSLPHGEAVICVNGDVVPCASDIRSQYVMGNVFNEDFKVIWNNKKYRHFRSLINKGANNNLDICQSCCKKNNPDFYLEA